jgi:hypothetical protein
MATRFSSLLIPDCSTDAHFRLWAQFIEDTLVTTGGWLVTADTGQTTPATLLHPTVGNTKQGYRIYTMNDALQSTAPVFMRIDFGMGLVSVPGIWITIGSGSDGAGNILNKWFDGGSLGTPTILPPGSSSTQVTNSYGSADTNRLSLGLFCYAGANYQLVFTIERTKDVSGNDTPIGLLLIYNHQSVTQTIDTTRFLYFGGGAQPTAENLNYILTKNNPSETFGGDIGVGVIIHFRGVAQQPGTNFMVVCSNDVSPQGQVSLFLYGQTRTYQHLDQIQPERSGVGAGFQDQNARCMIRYD